jgi:hypothetical protein
VAGDSVEGLLQRGSVAAEWNASVRLVKPELEIEFDRNESEVGAMT